MTSVSDISIKLNETAKKLERQKGRKEAVVQVQRVEDMARLLLPVFAKEEDAIWLAFDLAIKFERECERQRQRKL